MKIAETNIIIADDLTGANDTALQFFNSGSRIRIVIEPDKIEENSEDIDFWAISTETRNIDKEIALDKTIKITQKLQKVLNTKNIYKKIDSTLRGNVGVEILGMLEATQKDVALVVPAYIEEKRTTIGAYQLLDGIPIEQTQCARDPKSPVLESYIPDILKKDLNPCYMDLIGTIEYKTVSKGAGPIQLKINELVQKDKKIIVVDAVNNVDLEQIAFAIMKSNYNILPCASAGLASAFNKILDISNDKEQAEIKRIPKLPRLILSGSATKLAQRQIQELKNKKSDTIYFVDLTIEDILGEINDDMISKIVEKLNNGFDVVVHSSDLLKNKFKEKITDKLIENALPKDELSSKITDFIANIAYEIDLKTKFILILIGGETSFKCAKKISSNYLEIISAITPCVPLCVDTMGRIVVTKSGNFGKNETLCEIMDYFNGLA